MNDRAFHFRKWLRDAAERVAWTYLEVFVGLLLVGGALDVGVVEAAAVAAVPAALAAVKAALASRVGDRQSASTLRTP